MTLVERWAVVERWAIVSLLHRNSLKYDEITKLRNIYFCCQIILQNGTLFDYILDISDGRSAMFIKSYCVENSTYANSF